MALLWIVADQQALFDSPSIFSLLMAQGWLYFFVSITFLTAMSVVGDLVESMVKRHAGVKDITLGDDVVAVCSMSELGNPRIQYVTILGSTGSIGVNTLDVIARHPDRFKVFALTGASQVDVMLQQCLQFQPSIVVMAHPQSALQLKEKLDAHHLGIRVLSGPKAIEEVASDPQVDCVMAAIVGAAGLPACIAAALSGKRLLLANKEALVVGADIFLKAVQQGGATLIPIDSEHSAIFQSLPQDPSTLSPS
jgi:pimeloyl-ACP methyl ester carboxylesterase